MTTTNAWFTLSRGAWRLGQTLILGVGTSAQILCFDVPVSTFPPREADHTLGFRALLTTA